MKKNLFLLVMACVGMLFVGCKPEGQTGGETQIKSITIKNTTCQGQVDNTAFTVLFEAVPAETPVEALQFDAKCSLGAALNQKEYDFTKGASEDGKELVGTIKVVNGDNSQEYTVTIKLADPVENPKLAKLVMKKADGTEVVAGIFDESVALNMESESEATFGSITLYPTRASYRFTTMADNKISKDNPGQLVVEFMGKKTTYNLTFDAAPIPGADLTAPVIYDFSVNSGKTYEDFTRVIDGQYPDFLTRGSDFDGEYVLVVSRSDKTTPSHHLLKVSDLKQGSINKIMLSTKGIEGGEFPVSSGRLSQGHIYVCNLATAFGDGQSLKVYHYANATADPDIWECDGTGIVDLEGNEVIPVVRIGDNMSINLDESGNGYAFFCGQEDSAERMYRIEIKNFNEFSNPTEITLEEAFPYYGYVNQVDNDRYLLTSHYMASTWLINKDGQMITDILFFGTASGLRPQTGVDPRVIKYNNGYYMIFASPYNNTKHLGVGPAVYMIDITEGAVVSIEKGLQDLGETLFDDIDEVWEPSYHYSLDDENTQLEAKKSISVPSAQCNAAVVDGKLLVYAAATNAGFVIIEFPAAK